MEELVAPDKLGLFLYLCAPGLILTYFRSLFLTGRMPPPAEGVLTYVTLSIVYQAALLPLTDLSASRMASNQLPTADWAIVIFVAPAVLGSILGLAARYQWIRAFFRKMRINTVHPVGSAWDWRFGNCDECYVLVTLKNDTKWAGLLGDQSFLSSDPTERDIFLQQVFDWKDGETWSQRESSVWIAGAEIQSIEQWPKRKANDRPKKRWWQRKNRKRPPAEPQA